MNNLIAGLIVSVVIGSAITWALIVMASMTIQAAKDKRGQSIKAWQVYEKKERGKNDDINR